MGSYVGGNSAATTGAGPDLVTLSWPAGVASGDLALIVHVASDTQTGMTTPPVGFTIYNDTIDGNCRDVLSYRICDGTETGTVDMPTLLSTRQVGVIAVYRGYTGINVHNVAGEASATSVTTHTLPSVTTSVAGGPAIISISERASTVGSTITAWPSPYNSREEVGNVGSGGTFVALGDDLGSATHTSGQTITPGTITTEGGSIHSVARTFYLTPASALNLTVDVSDSLGLTDPGPTNNLTGAKSASPGDSLGITDTARNYAATAKGADSLGLTDLASAVLLPPAATPGSVADQLGFTDAGATVGGAVTGYDLESVIDLISAVLNPGGQNFTLTLTDFLSIGEVDEEFYDITWTQTDSVGLDDAQPFNPVGTTLNLTGTGAVSGAGALTSTAKITAKGSVAGAGSGVLTAVGTSVNTVAVTNAAAVGLGTTTTSIRVGVTGRGATFSEGSLSGVDSSRLRDLQILRTSEPFSRWTSAAPDNG